MPFQIPTELVGSIARPSFVQDITAAYNDDRATLEDVNAAHDKACAITVKLFEAVGQKVVSDGEQRSPSFATYPIHDTLTKGLIPSLSSDGGNYFAIFDDGHKRQLPKLVSGPFKYKRYAGDYVRETRKHTTLPIKQAVIAPTMMYLLYPDTPIDGYCKDDFVTDIIHEAVKDIRSCFEAGAARVTIDFTEGRLCLKNDERNGWTCKGLLNEFINILNSVLENFSPEERRNIGIHTCPGGDNDSVHSKDVEYEKLLKDMFKINAGYFLIQCASEENREHIYELLGKYSGDEQVCFVGVINPLNPRIETPAEVRDALLLAAKYIPKHRLGATDDCGFCPFSDDKKPQHGGPNYAREVAFAKIWARNEGARLASEILGAE
ncbi:UROD/MetE-like protein [Ascobolus immersus RN42]|uniref:UROD/MetE-like protein n=1 Tax=Ascobolus immersus RN42 TaxID=1160509 RepID=A0A3N4H9V6_ASCIM|nr:UROD/MetE-like protein [Ascobolus immersus RN42]